MTARFMLWHWTTRYGRPMGIICRVRANSRRAAVRSLARQRTNERAYIRSAKRNIRNECAILIRRVKGTLREERGYSPRASG